VCDVNQKVQAGWMKQSINFDVIRKYHSYYKEILPWDVLELAMLYRIECKVRQ